MPTTDEIKSINLSRKNSFINHKSNKTELSHILESKKESGDKKNEVKTATT